MSFFFNSIQFRSPRENFTVVSADASFKRFGAIVKKNGQIQAHGIRPRFVGKCNRGVHKLPENRNSWPSQEEEATTKMAMQSPHKLLRFFHHKFIANCTINTDAKPPKKTQRKQSPLQLPRLTVAHMPTDSQPNQEMSTS